MASITQPATQSPAQPAAQLGGPPASRTWANGFLFGVPVGDLGWFASILTSFSLGFAAFFFATFLAIVVFLFRNSAAHPVDFAQTYRLFGLPTGIAVLLLSLAYLGYLWARRIARR